MEGRRVVGKVAFRLFLIACKISFAFFGGDQKELVLII